jgi:hypothetical protein
LAGAVFLLLLAGSATGLLLRWPETETPVKPSPTSTPQGLSPEQRVKLQMIETEIDKLNRKISDQERRVREYEEWGSKGPGVSSIGLQQSARDLLQAYEKQKAELEMLKARIESGV